MPFSVLYLQSLDLGQIKPQELTGGALRRQSILGVYVLVPLAIAILALIKTALIKTALIKTALNRCLNPLSCFLDI
ncbi:hypothetical protein PseudUWO310_22420 [Pseudanabaena sp. UWO310]|nr:hypothetical protein PseudUWO310_22420 [Pseudanabaena sp. UWO310]